MSVSVFAWILPTEIEDSIRKLLNVLSDEKLIWKFILDLIANLANQWVGLGEKINFQVVQVISNMINQWESFLRRSHHREDT